MFIQSGLTPISPPQEFAVVVAGGVSLGSVVRFDEGNYACNDDAIITVSELEETGTFPDIPTEADVEARVTVEVIAPVCSGDSVTPCDDDVDCTGNGTCGAVVDSETNLNFTKDPAGFQFDSDPLQLSDGTARDPGNDTLDIRHGDTLRAVYTDKDTDTGNLTVIRLNTAAVSCTVDIGFGSIVFAQFGQNSSLLVQGGCERNLRDQFEFGFPDRYMDAGEQIILNFAFNSNEAVDLESVQAGLTCVQVDADSPADCLSSGAGCLEGVAPPEGCGPSCDPLRENNPPCVELTVLDTPKNIGFIPAGAAMSANYTIQMAGDGAGEPFEGQPIKTVELILEVTASVSGQSSSAKAISRQRLNVDAVQTFYSTDYPSGGTEVLDYGPGVAGNNDEIASNPIFENANFQSNDYRFETFVFAPLTTGTNPDGTASTPNLNLLSPWDFDRNDGGFRVGLAAPSDETAADFFNIHNWGEDKNFNNVEDGICVADAATPCYNFGNNTDVRCPVNTVCESVENNAQDIVPAFTQNWNTKGGCGWQTRTTGECSGDPTRGCLENEDCLGTCELLGNGISSTFDACSIPGDCPQVFLCNNFADEPLKECDPDIECPEGECVAAFCVGGDNNGLACDVHADCPGPAGFSQCIGFSQSCEDPAGFCGAVVGAHTGGVWHTGPIGNPEQACDGAEVSACANYKVIGGSTGKLLWWELLVTPVMEKVHKKIDPASGLPEATIEIFDWGWNTNINLVDGNASYTWEVDTDTSTLDPVDLFSDTSILNSGNGAYGAIDLGSNPDLTNGWPLFAPQAVCSTSPFGTCRDLFECSPGSCTSSANECHVDADCDPGTCTGGGGENCFSDGDCPEGEACTNPAPEGCVGKPTCDPTVPGGASENGSIGGDREGEAGCFFGGAILPETFIDLGAAHPRDDDRDNDEDGRENPLGACSGNDDPCNNDGDCSSGTCIGRCDSDDTACNDDGDCSGGADYCIPLSTTYDCDDGISNDREGVCTIPAGLHCNVDGDCGIGGTCTGVDRTDKECLNDPSIPCDDDLDCGAFGPCNADPECVVWNDIATGEKHGVDEFVSEAGPYRNHDIVAFNGPDMRFGTLEDIYGDTGDNFQAAIGFINFEGTTDSVAQQSYGVALDDMVFKWREFTLAADETDCGEGGSCAVVEVATTNVFQGETVLTISLLEPVPDPFNDCDLDGTHDGVTNCDAATGNTDPDVVVKVTSEAEVTGEIVVLNKVSGDEYKGTVPVSSLSDSPGVLYLSQQGTDNPTVTVTYLDNDIDPTPGGACATDANCPGTQNDCNLGLCGEECPNDVDPAKHGLVQTFTTVFLGETCEITIVGTEFFDNGDKDEFPDTEETADMRVCIINNCQQELHNCTGRIFSNSPTVECILDSTIDMGDLANIPDIVCIDDTFRWKVADVQRQSAEENLLATFGFTMSCDEIDGLSVAQDFSMSVDIDLDAGGQPSVEWLEGFEGGTLGKFFAENLDEGIPGQNNTEGHINGDGWRCQYSDPDWVNSNSYGNAIAEDCYPGATLNGANAIYWGIDGFDTSSPDGGRAKTGSYSMYYGVYLTDPPSSFTTPLAVVESVATVNPVNLGVGVPNETGPLLTWWQQVSLVDGRGLNVNESRSADRGVVQYKETSGDDWIRLEPFQNTYDTQGYDFYFNCMFDPVDDGTTEDNFFDPEDPNRRLGPSSTCHPEFAYSCIGNTDLPFAVENICNGTTQPGPTDTADLGTGTWVQSKVDLTGLKGRRIDLRFMVTSIKASSETQEGQFEFNPSGVDDGWWLDDISIDDTLSLPATLLVDNDVIHHCSGDTDRGCISDADPDTDCDVGPCSGFPNFSCNQDPTVDCQTNGDADCDFGTCSGAAPQCGESCTTVSVVVATTPDVDDCASVPETCDELLSAPGQPIELNAAGSSAVCLNGSLQYRFEKDGGATLIRNFSENAVLLDAPSVDTDYVVTVRCSTDVTCSENTAVGCFTDEDCTGIGTCSGPPRCDNSATVDVNVNCPSTDTLVGIFPETIRATTKTLFSWPTPVSYDLFSGDLGAVSSYTGTMSSGTGNSFAAAATPGSGAGFYYIVRGGTEFCNEIPGWSSGGSGEQAGRDAALP
jgi:hypothetical protein